MQQHIGRPLALGDDEPFRPARPFRHGQGQGRMDFAMAYNGTCPAESIIFIGAARRGGRSAKVEPATCLSRYCDRCALECTIITWP